jgi:pantoate--beta-alanine ligase
LSELKVFTTAAQVRAWSREQKAKGSTVGFVPTMGALHEGHASLLRIAGKQCDAVVLSIFVNPTQFGPGEDFEKYPRTWESDLEVARREGVQAVFAPARDFYPEGHRTVVSVPGWNGLWEGEIRPGHFDGVATVVTKLLLSTECDVAVFGQKDAQQALLLRRMVKDLDFGLKLVVAPIVREADGLALSSRNRYLTSEQRRRALALSRALMAAVMAWESGVREPSNLLASGAKVLEADAPDSIDYFSLLDPETLECLDQREALTKPALLVVAARYGATRLLDNAALGAVWD